MGDDGSKIPCRDVGNCRIGARDERSSPKPAATCDMRCGSPLEIQRNDFIILSPGAAAIQNLNSYVN
jgi:hypothetical protein